VSGGFQLCKKGFYDKAGQLLTEHNLRTFKNKCAKLYVYNILTFSILQVSERKQASPFVINKSKNRDHTVLLTPDEIATILSSKAEVLNVHFSQCLQQKTYLNPVLEL